MVQVRLSKEQVPGELVIGREEATYTRGILGNIARYGVQETLKRSEAPGAPLIGGNKRNEPFHRTAQVRIIGPAGRPKVDLKEVSRNFH